MVNPTAARTWHSARSVSARLAYAWRGLTQPSAAILISALIAPVSGGCWAGDPVWLGMRMALEAPYVHSTSFVTPIPVTPSPLPNHGSIVAVSVEDVRPDVADYEVGAKYGFLFAYEASTIDFKDKASLANQLALDAVAGLREQGYRAHDVREAPGDDAEVRLVIRIAIFSTALVVGADIRLEGLFLIEAVSPGIHRRWTDAVGARFELPTTHHPSDEELQKYFELLYTTLRDKMRERLRVALQHSEDIHRIQRP
jgi:hypothetical protein